MIEQTFDSNTPHKAYRGIGMEGYTAKWYASTTRRSMDDFKALARRVADETAPNSRVLEIAPGPGYFAIELKKLGPYHVTGVDISRTMVDIARRNAAEASVNVDFRLGNASALGFADDSFDFLLCRAAFKNFSEPVKALQEMCRVLRKGGRALIIDLRGDASNADIAKLVEGMHIGAVNAWITKMTFRFLLLRRAYTRAQFEEMIEQTGFSGVQIFEDRVGLDVTLEK